jgi:hypothetical protein
LKILENVTKFVDLFYCEQRVIDAKSYLLKGEFDAAKREMDDLLKDKPYFAAIVGLVSTDVGVLEEMNLCQAAFFSLVDLINDVVSIQKSLKPVQ